MMPVKSKFACQPSFDFHDHLAIVTGGSRGIGRAIADALGEAEAALPELADPRDVSNAVLFLLSDAARAITGDVLRVDAGQYI